jgi:hypothetical protein
MLRSKLAHVAVVAVIAIAAIVGGLVGSHLAHTADAHADITVEPCSFYASHAQAPAYTFTGACVASDGSLSLATTR